MKLPPLLLAALWLVLPIVLAGGSLNAGEEAKRQLLTTQNAQGELAGWKWYCEDPEVGPGEVWSLDEGVLSCKGKPRGYLYTEQDYTNFVLTLQWRWPPGTRPGRGGVLVRTTGPHQLWPRSLEAQLNAGGEGDFWGLAGYGFQGPAERLETVDHPQFGQLTHLEQMRAVGRPAGLWNECELVVKEGTVQLKINGTLVNQATDAEVVAGKICLTAEGDKIQFRQVSITKLQAPR